MQIVFVPVAWDGVSEYHTRVDTALCEAMRLTQQMRTKIDAEWHYWAPVYPAPKVFGLVENVHVELQLLFNDLLCALNGIREKKAVYILYEQSLAQMTLRACRIHLCENATFRACLSKDETRVKPTGTPTERRAAFRADSKMCLTVLNSLYKKLYKDGE